MKTLYRFLAKDGDVRSFCPKDLYCGLSAEGTIAFTAWEFDHPNHPLASQPFVTFEQFDDERGHNLLKPVGTVLLVQIKKPGLHMGQVEDLIVDPKYIDRGVAFGLLERLVLHARHVLKLDRLVTSLQSADAMSRLFPQLGFKPNTVQAYALALNGKALR